MAQINTFNNQPGAIFKDNSVTINAQQNNTLFNTENNIQPVEDTYSSAHLADNGIRLNPQKGTKANLFRVIIALQKTGFFIDKTGRQATQKDVFNAFGALFGEDFSTYQKNISAAVQHNSNSDASTKIFDTLKEAFQEYEDSKIQ